MAHPKEFNVNYARLPRFLSGLLFKLHVTKCTSGLVLLAAGITCMIVYGTNLYVIVLGACLSSLFAGLSGTLAIKTKSLALHGGTAITSAISFYLSLLAYAACTGAAAATITNAWLILITVLVLAVDIMVAALNVGMELSVMYVAVSNQRIARENNLHETIQP